MFKKVLLPTDLSESSKITIPVLRSLVPAGVEEVLILHVIDQRLLVQIGETYSDTLLNAMRREGEEQVSNLAQEVREMGVKVETRVLLGVPHHQIVGMASASGSSLILMSAYGKGMLCKVLLGSTAENVMRHTTTTLLLVRGEIREEGGRPVCIPRGGNPFERILFPTDFSGPSLECIPRIKQLRSAGLKNLIVAYIRDVTQTIPHLLERLPGFEEIDSKRLGEVKRLLEGEGFDVETILRDGIPFIEIDAITQERDVGTVVIGSHGKSMVKEMLIGGIAGRLVRRLTRNVMIVRKSQ